MVADTSILVLAFALFLCLILSRWYNERKNNINQINRIPGVKTYPLVGTTYMFFGKSRNETFDVLLKEAIRFPYISRLWIGPFPQVCIRKAEYVEKVIGSTKNLEKSFGYKFIRYWLGEGLLISGGNKWQKHRKIITPTFHFSILETFFDVFSDKSKILIERLDEHCGTGEPFDIYSYITKAAMDIICEAAMGVSVRAQEKGTNTYVDAVYQVSQLIMNRVVRPWLHPNFIYKHTKAGKEFHECLQTLHGYSADVIQLRKMTRKEKLPLNGNGEVKKNRLAFLDLLLEANENENLLTDKEIREEVDTFMFEGHDTTTAGITWTIFLLGLHPEIQDKVYNELDSIFHGSDRKVTLSDMSEMKYLERVIKEAMRLYPPVPIIGRRLSENIQLDEYCIPEGCMIKIDLYNLHRDPRFFADPETFDPDRFLPDSMHSRHPFAYLPFSAGPRNCIGQKFAAYEQKAVVSTILRHFTVRAVDKRHDVKMINELVLRPIGGINVTLHRR
ncbi:Cytochrome P450 4C1 [Pseudolycoriella hygida]|uniref:Cytochrome P450 4C1 n=1 Tax=Pseudolycoriella hygida TaxID=35572 RepID=A0A9Q0RW51_9DIPT|nr:Cytochrome P450 4C1 [Pseudolycoriella hygida]